MKILFMAHDFPYPPHEGIRLHVYELLKHLSKIHEIHFFCFSQSKEDHAHLHHIRPYCASVTIIDHKIRKSAWTRLWNIFFQKSPYSILLYESADMHQAVREICLEQHFDVAHLEFMLTAAYANDMGNLPKIFSPCDCMSMLFERNMKKECGILRRWYLRSQWKKMKRYEKEILPNFTRTVMVSPVDKAALEAHGTGAAIVVNPFGVDTEFFSPQPIAEEPATLLFRGMMDFLPNVDAAYFFAHDVMPLIWNRDPRVVFMIAGAQTPERVKRWGDKEKRIRVLGYVPDLREPMARATVVVCPMRTGSGVKIKILESMAMAKALVVTPMSCAGIEARPEEHFLAAETPQELAAQTLRLLADPSLRKQLGERARHYVMERHSWASHTSRLNQIFEEVVKQ